MGAKQRESVHVVLDRIHGHPPASNRMAVLAGRAELAAMDVGVTVRALFSNIAENLIDMALSAGYILVQASQRELGLGIMVELGLGAYRLPAHGGVAALAGCFE